jgi:hypothetical protein
LVATPDEEQIGTRQTAKVVSGQEDQPQQLKPQATVPQSVAEFSWDAYDEERERYAG